MPTSSVDPRGWVDLRNWQSRVSPLEHAAVDLGVADVEAEEHGGQAVWAREAEGRAS
jgi:hypothetical protein